MVATRLIQAMVSCSVVMVPAALRQAEATGAHVPWAIDQALPRDQATMAARPSTSALPNAEPRPGITLVWLDIENQLPSHAPVVAAEAMDILDATGIPFRWRVGDPTEPTLATPDGRIELPVIVKAREHRPERRARRALGATLSAGGPQPIWILVEPIRRMLGHDRLLVRSRRDVRLLAHAVGRVLAHEVVHCLAPEHGHAHEGLMQAVFTLDALRAPHAALDDQCLAAMRMGWARLVQQLAMVPARGDHRIQAN